MELINNSIIPSNKVILKVLYSIFSFVLFFISFITINQNNLQKNYIYDNNVKIQTNNKLIKENFFVIDSNNLKKVKSHMYGYSISKEGILTDNYYKKIGYYNNPDPQGAYVLIRKKGNEIKLFQDFYGSYGLYIYRNENTEYFAISNSFLLLEEYLINKQNISINEDFADSFITSKLCTPTIYETMIKEITTLPSNAVISIKISTREYKLYFIDYKENSVPIESEEGIKIIDKWVDKWGFIFRSLQKKTNNFSFDLSGGYDTRTLLSILISSGVDINKIKIHTAKDNRNPDHKEDFKIANNISAVFGLKLNEYNLDKQSIIWSTQNSLFCSLYSKLGFHKEFYFKTAFYKKPRFIFTGQGGENIRGYPGSPYKKYLERISFQGKQIKGYKEKFYNSTMRLCKRSIDIIKKEKNYKNNYELSSALYSKGRTRYHYGKAAVEGFISNIYLIQPLIDPDIKKIKYEINGNLPHDLIAFIYFRFAHDLIYFPIQGNRTLNKKSIKKAEKLNSMIKPYIIKTSFNKNFFIDDIRKSPVTGSNINKNADDYLKELFHSSQFIKKINKIYNNDVYEWVMKQSKNTNFFPLRHGYGLLAIAYTVSLISLNKKYMNKL